MTKLKIQSTMVLIEPKWNLKITGFIIIYFSHISINRTKVEFKAGRTFSRVCTIGY